MIGPEQVTNIIDPISALIIALILLAVMVFIFWPDSGLIARWQGAKRGAQRILIEDALKHLYDCEYKRLTCTLKSISGALSIDGDKAAKLMKRLESLGLLKSHGEVLELRSNGRSYALRIIRVHRLWERYLADETGFDETKWHPEAEKYEHIITTDEANILAAQMGNPYYDPHGDPIPTPSGDIPLPKGIPLTDLPHGNLAQIIHMEDEPGVVFSQLIALGLYVGMQIQVIGSSKERIRFIANGEENILAPIVAANVTVVQLADDDKIEDSFATLSGLKPGHTGVVVNISKACRGQQRRRLMDLGILPGTVVKAEMSSASGDPVAYRIRGAMIAIRKQQANLIHIRYTEEAA